MLCTVTGGKGQMSPSPTTLPAHEPSHSCICVSKDLALKPIQSNKSTRF